MGDHKKSKLQKLPKYTQVAPQMRNAFMAGLVKYADQQNKTIVEVVAGWWEDDWVAAGNLLTKFMPKEVKVDAKVEHNHEFRVLAVSRVNEFLAEVIDTDEGGAGISYGDNEGVGAERPLLSVEIPSKEE